ncbi:MULTISPECIES: type I phosphomannose isomerase catalytic subunit [unclassified Lentimonas]|uniref:type I phosphomannose isomerase catalytic subunit n=1 Tax=unclassified Lentimonas TaxID=2630993 RepID=UPI00132B8330|nr:MULTISPECIES: type I phosphomannose isomerase catalytic subunit [unclassified Lentimonas]CAA6677898.1 Mannose-6-phosphate isomerase (EC [Lentimonas sp. CC4]CAA6684002.1 Mannose-6-phosphate isomerase (EC [Lentimonas sp. CC6]CAA7076622.1 Mannose-6-phosphate isomerase (EC [Lentimonas sp. CC4]CAA7170049.1 Mannose-6-phosphate isomerase (EC [Lentimonas sp. CC21]CAA7181334.1 Mannose-6-phosphate isomerase (EC [Lentimonas sp. CC8]
MKHILLSPIYQERVWGGRSLSHKLNRTLPENKVIGESWEIVDRPEAQSTTSQGQTIRELISADPESIMGAGWPAERPFPILVKWLDCQEKLSLQVHPPADIAQKLNGEPKTECWYIADAEPHATLIAGLKNGVTREDFEAGLANNTLESLVHTISVKAGESIFIPSGRIHAIGGGNLILEIQQNSDTTYRVYDWGRVGLDGSPRDLHIEESLKSSDFNDFEPDTIKPNGGSQTLAESDVFDLRKVCLKAGETLSFDATQPRILSVLIGALKETTDGAELQRGDNALLPASQQFAYNALQDTEVLITENFNQ